MGSATISNRNAADLEPEGRPEEDLETSVAVQDGVVDDLAVAPSAAVVAPSAPTTTFRKEFPKPESHRPAHVRSKLPWFLRPGSLPFVAVHLGALGTIWTGITWQAAVLCAVLFFVRMFAVTGGYHRYFSHRTFKTSRVGQFLLAVLAQTTAQKGCLWWAAHHRHHHAESDTEHDLHSPHQSGFWYAHLGWLFDDTSKTDYSRVRDLAKYPELVWLNKLHLLPAIALGVASWWFFGWSGLCFGFLASTVFTWHATFTINSLTHMIGNRRFETTDDSRNCLPLALLTMGEGWHNNHHHYQACARQGFYWWEIDITYYILRTLGFFGLVWNIRQPPQRVLEEGRRLDAERRAKQS